MKLSDILKASGNKYASLASDGLEGSDTDTYIQTGSFAFNALLSGSLYGGIPDNKIIALAGEQATGKTYFAMNIVREFLASNSKAMVLYFDSEQAVTKDLLTSRGIDCERVAVFPVATVEDFRGQCISVVDKYLETNKEDRPPMLVVLDSLGMLSTTKEMTDTAAGKDTRDMTRAQAVKATFRVLTIKLGHAHIPLIMTNHTYDAIGSFFPTKEMGGGCLVAGTKIHTKEGVVPIEEIVIGDEILTLFGYRGVTDTFKFCDKELYEIEFDDGTIVKCSAEHKFMVESEDGYVWVCAKDISEGFSLMEADLSIHTSKESICSINQNTPNGISLL